MVGMVGATDPRDSANIQDPVAEGSPGAKRIGALLERSLLLLVQHNPMQNHLIRKQPPLGLWTLVSLAQGCLSLGLLSAHRQLESMLFSISSLCLGEILPQQPRLWWWCGGELFPLAFLAFWQGRGGGAKALLRGASCPGFPSPCLSDSRNHGSPRWCWAGM